MSDANEYYNMLCNKELPYEVPEEYTIKSLEFVSIRYKTRVQLVELAGFALLAGKWIKPLSNFLKGSRCLEVMAGCGSLSYFLKQDGIDIIVTDSKDTNMIKTYVNGGEWNEWLPVEKLDCLDAIDKYPDVDYILMSWPEACNPMAYETLIKMRETNPKCKMIYIGETHGCSGDSKFFTAMQIIQDETFNIIKRNYISHAFMYDDVLLIK